MVNMANSSLCLTPACLEAASHILWQMAPNWDKMDPCTDFEQMVCYRYPEQNVEDKSTLAMIGEQNARVLREILELPYTKAVEYQSVPWKSTYTTDKVDESNFDMLKLAYQTCLDHDAIEAAGAAPLEAIIAEQDSIWPINTADLKSTIGADDYAAFSKAVYYMEDLGISSVLKVFAGANIFKDSKSVIFKIAGPDSSQTNHSVFSDEAAMKAYATDIATALAYYLPTNISQPTAQLIANDVVKLDAHLFAFSGAAVPPSSMTEEIINFSTVKELSDSIPVLDLEWIIAALAPPDFGDATIMTETAAYWVAYDKIFDNFSKTTVQAWMAYRTVQALVPYVDTTRKRTWVDCLSHTEATFRHVITRFFVAARFPDDAKTLVESIAEKMKAQVAVNIGKAMWMEIDDRNRTVKKAENMLINVGYRTSNPDVRSPESLASYYKDVNITRSFFHNVLARRRHESNQQYASTMKPTDRGLLDQNSYSANAAYHPYYNTVNMFANILQLPIFHHELPSYATFGGIGSVIGHEIFHAFDPNSIKFDENSIHHVWWDNDTTANYQSRAQCIVDQFNNITVPVPGGLTEQVNGELTLAENLADAGGIRAAYDAWRNMKKMDGKPDANLPGLEHLTHDQLFYVFFANTWCSSFTEEYNDNGWDNEEHAPGTARIIGATANSRGFREAFKCKSKEPTCEVW